MKFGTDGLRGRAGVDITTQLAHRLGAAVATVLGRRVCIARDSRPSSPELAAAVAHGVASVGGDAELLGLLPTAGLSVGVLATGAHAGVMVTASHNPAADNGLKVVGPDGRKLGKNLLRSLEAALAGPAAPPLLGGSVVERSGEVAYLAAVRERLPPGEWLRGRRVLFDAAAGSGTEVGERLLAALGAEVIPFGGPVINERCGAVHPEFAVAALLEARADVGILLDGDADRIALIDHRGNVLDGDAILYLNREGPVMVGTVMSNLGLERALEGEGIRLLRTPVGDAYVAEAMKQPDVRVGGEPSGHILFADGLPTGDGLLAGLRTLLRRPDLDTDGYTPAHQAHAAVRGVVYRELDVGFVTRAGGRAVIRPSGTEPVVRVMVEHEDLHVANALRDTLVRQLEGST